MEWWRSLDTGRIVLGSMADTVLTTRRLELRRLRADDLDWLARLHGDPEVMRHIREPDDRAATEARLSELLAAQARSPGLGVFPAVERETEVVVGWFVLTHLDGSAEIELGCRLFPSVWGRGLATEGAVGLRDHAFAALGLARLVAVAREENRASLRVLEQAGFRRRGHRVAYGAELAFFESFPNRI